MPRGDGSLRTCIDMEKRRYNEFQILYQVSAPHFFALRDMTLIAIARMLLPLSV